jgi:phage terminase large subunit-like protein
VAVLRFPAETKNGKSAWPRKFPMTELAKKKEVLGDLRYAQQYLISPIALSGTELALDWIYFYDQDDYEPHEDLEYFFGVDPSISGKNDYFVIAVVSKGNKGKMYVEDIVREQADLGRMIQLLERTAAIYKPTVVNVEAVAAQELLVQDLRDRSPLPIRSYYPGKMNKQDRIKVMAQVYFQSKKILIKGFKNEDGQIAQDPAMEQFVLEWVGFPRMKHDDTLDAVGAAIECATSSGIAASVSSDDHQTTPYEDRTAVRYRRWGWA